MSPTSYLLQATVGRELPAFIKCIVEFTKEVIILKYDIKGFHKVSFVDYPGKMAAVLFVGGCNFACPYCHNASILKGDQDAISWEDTIKPYLIKRQKLLDGVVVSGGEPSLHPWVLNLMADLKSLGYAIKLDTNGSHPGFIKQAVEKGLVDYIAMDIKSPLHKYEKVCRCHVDNDLIRTSIQYIMQSEVDYQFRTTVVPTLIELNDIKEIIKEIKGAKCYALQQFKPVETMLDKNLLDIKPYSLESIQPLKEQADQYIQKVELVNF